MQCFIQAAVAHAYHNQQPILHPFLCADNGGVVYSSKSLPLAGREPGTFRTSLYIKHASLLLYTLVPIKPTIMVQTHTELKPITPSGNKWYPLNSVPVHEGVV